jgi:ABC-type proline/glycine betaine transport system permease subunit
MVNKELNKPLMTLDDAITEYKNIYLNKDKYTYYKKISDNVDNSVDTIVNNANHNSQYINNTNTMIHNKNKNKFKINYKYVIIVLLCIIGIIIFLYNNI